MNKTIPSLMSGTGARRLLGSVLLSLGLLLQSDPVSADNPVPTPLPGGPTKWSTVTVTTLQVAPDQIQRPSEGHPKLDSSLNQLLEVYHQAGMVEAQAFARLRMLVLDDHRVQVEILTTYEPANTSAEGSRTGASPGEQGLHDLIGTIQAAGGEYQGHYRALVRALVPVDILVSLAGRFDVQVIREARRAIPLVTSEGVAAANATNWHAQGYDGAGVQVAIVDAGFTGYSGLLGTDLPSSVTARDYTGTGLDGTPHGTACAEIVHDMAPAATMYLSKVDYKDEFGNAVSDLIADHVDVISMSLGWMLDGPGDGTGYLADIVREARLNGIFFAVAAGNDAQVSWSGIYEGDGSGKHLWASGQTINYFGPGDGQAYTLLAGDAIACGLHWDDWSVVNQDYDLELYRQTGTSWTYVDGSYNRQAAGYPTPEESIDIYAPYTGSYGVAVLNYSTSRNSCLRLVCTEMGHLDEWTPARSLSFPADAPSALTVGAIDVNSFDLEPYSSQGPTFGPGGTCSGGSIKPDIAGYTNVSTVSYGPGAFNGTSAATPHVAGAAALVKEAYPAYAASQLEIYLENKAIDLGPAGKDNSYGAGRLFLGSLVYSYTIHLPIIMKNQP
jgi:subtilisin family serine protease